MLRHVSDINFNIVWNWTGSSNSQEFEKTLTLPFENWSRKVKDRGGSNRAVSIFVSRYRFESPLCLACRQIWKEIFYLDFDFSLGFVNLCKKKKRRSEKNRGFLKKRMEEVYSQQWGIKSHGKGREKNITMLILLIN